ncbi:alkaline phosphatase like protein [Aquipluma nitroreducens]|uniref:Alkaline phosphatase like protein n=1 Tax=Aquipluma nitroreducens TaxID=2010828 RepID=A0A5K7SDB5_9BACT|nr:DedA family protein [Aquipluma nitroreducens]BBE19573.1 alkaline phosphatase like protein [Aquipluma nitroreducens]
MLEYFQTLADWYMQHMNYLSITLLMIIESSFIPFPSEIVIPPAIWKAAGGDLNMPLVVLFATLGAVIGAVVNYVLALWLGRVIVYKLVETRLGKIFMLSQHKVENAEVYFNRHGRSSTFIGRLVPGIRQLISIPAGLAKMNFKQFILFTTLGSALWNVILAVLSYSLYTQQDMLKKYMSELSYALLAAGVLFVVYLIWKYRKKKE